MRTVTAGRVWDTSVRVAELSPDVVRSLLRYEPETGNFIRLVQTSRRIKVGDVAGGKNAIGYIQVSVAGHVCLAHRLAWFYMTGEWPKDQIDHINGDRSDNRWSNLREADKALNMQNQRRAPKHNRSTGLLGASKSRYGYRSQIWISDQHYHLGYYKTAEEAHQAYLVAKRKLHRGGML